MADESIHPLLQALHDRLDAVTSLPAEDRRLLERLQGDIRAALERSGPAPAGTPSLLAQLGEVATRLEASHPDLTAAIVSVSRRLGDMGI